MGNDDPLRSTNDLEDPDRLRLFARWNTWAASDALETRADAKDAREMSFKELWHNGTKRLLIVLIVISAGILLLVGGIVAGIFYQSIKLRAIDQRVASVSDRQNDIVGQVAGNVSAITELSQSVNEGWQAFQQSNPTQPVPQISDLPVPDGKTEVIIKPPIAPKSTPKPSVVNTKTIIKYRSRPTPTPFRLFHR